MAFAYASSSTNAQASGRDFLGHLRGCLDSRSRLLAWHGSLNRLDPNLLSGLPDGRGGLSGLNESAGRRCCDDTAAAIPKDVLVLYVKHVLTPFSELGNYFYQTLALSATLEGRDFEKVEVAVAGDSLGAGVTV